MMQAELVQGPKSRKDFEEVKEGACGWDALTEGNRHECYDQSGGEAQPQTGFLLPH